MNEVNVQRSKLLADGMLHIEFLDGNSYLYSLQEIADVISNQLQSDVLPRPACCASFVAYGTHHEDCRNNPTYSKFTQTNSEAQPT